MTFKLKAGLLAAVFSLLTACMTTYYSVWEKLGKEKRDLLKDNVENVKEDQEDVKKEFSSALEQIKATYGMKPSTLEETYDKLKRHQERAESKADELSKRIDKVETIGNDLFSEWKSEAKSLSTPSYRETSEKNLAAAKTKFATLMTSLRASEKKLPPLLKKLKEQTIFLKHNLNAKSLGVFKKEGESIESDIDVLIRDLKKSSNEADQFISTLDSDA